MNTWRYRCPEGHTISSVRCNNRGDYYCRSCKDYYSNLQDLKTGGVKQ